MNRAKKEWLKAQKEARVGLTPDQIAELDKNEANERRLQEITSGIHSKLFPEEYDFMYDDHIEYKERNQGKNPMSADYVERVNDKRKKLGLPPLNESGLADSGDSWDMCYQMAKEQI